MAHKRPFAYVLCAGLSLSASIVSAQGLTAGAEALAAEFVKSITGARQLRIAVGDFADLQNVTCDAGRFIASRLTTRLAQSAKFSVVERQRLGQVLAELKFSMSDLVDPAKAKQLGRMAGVDAIVVGTVADLGNQVAFDSRLIDIESNRHLLSAEVTIGKDPTVATLMERGCQQMAQASSAMTSSSPSAPVGLSPTRIALQSKRVGDLTIGVNWLLISKGRITVALDFVNNSDHAMILGVGQYPNPSLLDERGNAFVYARRGSMNWFSGGFNVITDDFLTLNAKSNNDVLMEFSRADRAEGSEIGTTFAMSFTFYLTNNRREKLNSSHTVSFNELKGRVPK